MQKQEIKFDVSLVPGAGNQASLMHVGPMNMLHSALRLWVHEAVRISKAKQMMFTTGDEDHQTLDL